MSVRRRIFLVASGVLAVLLLSPVWGFELLYHYGVHGEVLPEPQSNTRPFLVRKIVDALRHRPPALVSDENEMAATKNADLPKQRPPQRPSRRDPRLPPVGTVLEREHGGKTIRVKVLEEGFEFRGKTYPSLSTVANEATGTTWNGFLFFRLIPYATRAKKTAR